MPASRSFRERLQQVISCRYPSLRLAEPSLSPTLAAVSYPRSLPSVRTPLRASSFIFTDAEIHQALLMRCSSSPPSPLVSPVAFWCEVFRADVDHAAGGNIVSTYPVKLGAYAALSGTSMVHLPCVSSPRRLETQPTSNLVHTGNAVPRRCISVAISGQGKVCIRRPWCALAVRKHRAADRFQRYCGLPAGNSRAGRCRPRRRVRGDPRNDARLTRRVSLERYRELQGGVSQPPVRKCGLLADGVA